MRSNPLFEVFLDSLGNVSSHSSDGGLNPLVVDADIDMMPIRLVTYIYNCIDPQGGRPSGEYKINISLRGQTTGQRCNFDYDAGFVLLVGYIKNFDVFVLWDAYKHKDFAHRSNLQVRQSTILDALVDGISTQQRRIRNSDRKEIVICCTSRNLEKAILHRYYDYIDDMCSEDGGTVQSRLF